VKLTVLAVGKLRESWVRDGCTEYEKRVRARLPLDVVEVKTAAELARRLPPRAEVWALDERGRELSSAELAEELRRRMSSGSAGIALLIGGADGLPAEIVAGARVRWSLGRLTLPHRLARLVVLEQLYRALSIVRGEPYHRE
jgi:23S rRNA (pseudouridine1915-N3)-methyltransferase